MAVYVCLRLGDGRRGEKRLEGREGRARAASVYVRMHSMV